MYFLFQYDQYESYGGAGNCRGIFDSIQSAENAFDKKTEYAEIAIVKGNKLKVIERCEHWYGHPLVWESVGE